MVRNLGQEFRSHGHELYVAGGAVRDAVMGRPVNDYDFATSATPDEVMRLFRRVIPTGIKHGTVTVLYQGRQFEVTTYRIEGPYADRRHPDTVEFTRSLQQDLSRRDFTMNAMAQDPESGAIIDPFGGRDDIARRVIRTVGDPRRRLGEDALRMVRAVRFAARLEFELAEDLRLAIRAEAAGITDVSAERIAQELDRMMDARRPSTGWRLADQLGLLGHIVPELREDLTVAGCPPIFDHLLMSADCAPRDDIDLRWAALLHDVGKPRRLSSDAKGMTFIGHDEESAAMARTVLARLRCANHRIDRVSHLIRHHMFGYRPDWSDAAVRRLLARVGTAHIRDLIRLRAADACGKAGRPVESDDLMDLLARVADIEASGVPLTRADLAVDGRDVMAALDLKPGPTIGMVLDELFEAVLADPGINEPARLLTIARRFATERLGISPSPSDDRQDSGRLSDHGLTE